MFVVEATQQKEILNKFISSRLGKAFFTREVKYADDGLHVFGFLSDDGKEVENKKCLIPFDIYRTLA